MRAIDADALKKIWCDDCENKHLCEDGTPACYDVQQVDALPTIETEPVKHGRWNKVVHSNNHITYYCSECGSIFNKGCADLGDFNYCPNCGARMDEVEE